jgi:hypothetical protein
MLIHESQNHQKKTAFFCRNKNKIGRINSKMIRPIKYLYCLMRTKPMR